MYSDFKTTVIAKKPIGEDYDANLKSLALYDALCHNVYEKMYKQFKQFCDHIREITKYPQ